MADIVIPSSKRLFTLGQLPGAVKESGGPDVSVHQVKYAVDQYGITPATRVGILRVWSEDALPQIKRALACIAENRRRRC